MKSKKPSNTMCVMVVVLLVFILLICGFFYRQIDIITEPLVEVDEMYKVTNSEYANLEIIDSGVTYNIYKDIDTDVLYIELSIFVSGNSFAIILFLLDNVKNQMIHQ